LDRFSVNLMSEPLNSRLVQFGSDTLINLQSFLFSMYILLLFFIWYTPRYNFSITHNIYVIKYYHTPYIKENTMIFKHIFQFKQSWQNIIHRFSNTKYNPYLAFLFNCPFCILYLKIYGLYFVIFVWIEICVWKPLYFLLCMMYGNIWLHKCYVWLKKL
jgi:hypothetical protein